MHRTNGFGEEYMEVHNLFQDLNDVCTNSEFSRLHPRSTKRLSNLFLTSTTESLPFPWFQPVKPSTTDRFLVHLLLSMGSFTTEFELFYYADFKQCFIAARLFTTLSDLDEKRKSCYKLVQTYFKEQLLSMPLGIRSKDAQLVVVYETLGDLLLRNTISTKDLPPALYNRLNKECTARVKLYLKNVRNNLLNVIYSDLSQVGINLPSRTSFDEATFLSCVDWDISNLVASPRQPDASVREQRKVLI
jgi:hypothetical protein